MASLPKSPQQAGAVEMVKKGSLPGVELRAQDEYVLKCIGCGLGKMHKEPHKRRTWRRANKLELIHTDLCGPMDKSTLLHGKSYFMTFIDDCTRRSWVRLLAHKDEALECFKQWLAEVKRETGMKVKELKSDGGGEYVNSSFKEFLNVGGIRRQLIIARTPQQNGVAERINRTLIDGVRSMLHGVGLSKGFWGWALECFHYTRNRVPTRGRSDELSPYEAWFGRKPNLSHLKTFGSPVLYRYDDQSGKKLDPRARKGILVGYCTNKTGYCKWDKDLHKLLDVRELVSMPHQTTSSRPLQAEEIREPQTAEVSIQGQRKSTHERARNQLGFSTLGTTSSQSEEVRDLQTTGTILELEAGQSASQEPRDGPPMMPTQNEEAIGYMSKEGSEENWN